MEFDILDSLDDIGYPGIISGDSKIKNCIECETSSVEFTQLVEWISKELQCINGLESCIHSISSSDDWSSFLLEISSFIREIHCPYKCLTTGPVDQRLQDTRSRVILLDFLCTELQASRAIHSRVERENDKNEVAKEDTVISSLDEAIKVLNVKTDSNDPLEILSSMEKQISAHLDLVPRAALQEHLTEEQWDTLSDTYSDMCIEYSVRRELLLTRLDVTLQSFKWGERCQSKETEILNAYVHRRKKLKREPAVKLSDIIAAREDIFVIEKTSSAALVKNTKSSLNRILIDAVPDRGGRPKEQRPPVEMPNWSKRSAGGGGRGGFQGRGGGGHHGHGKRHKEHKGGKKGRSSFDAAGSY